jgi:hypothetical protein
MTTELGFSQFSIWRSCECVSKPVGNKPVEDNIKQFNDRGYQFLGEVFQNIIQYTVWTCGLAALEATASSTSTRLVHLQEQRHMLAVPH